MREPSVGQLVWYWQKNGTERASISAKIAKVHTTDCVDLLIEEIGLIVIDVVYYGFLLGGDHGWTHLNDPEIFTCTTVGAAT